MFKPQGYGEEIFKKRYALHPEEAWEDACHRVANHVASAESVDKIKKYQDLFYGELVNNRFMPGGRIWYGSGRPKAATINCFCLEPEDSREGWAKLVGDMIVITGLGGGVGINFSNVRPRGEIIKGTGGESTGAVSLMELINAAGEVIKGGGGRRAALMECLNIDHPDLLEFLDKKTFKVSKSKTAIKNSINDKFPRLKTDSDFQQILDKSLENQDSKDLAYCISKALHDQILHNANVSVVIPYGKLDSFIDAVKNDKDWELSWKGAVKKTIKAKELWTRLIDNAYDSAEPGVLNFDLAERMNNIGYKYPISATNPCSEITLPKNSLCCLGHLVLPRFVNDKGKINWEQLAETISLGIRFLDNVLDVNLYPNNDIKEMSFQTRRIGMGIIGLHDLLLKAGLKYNSKEGLELVDQLMNFIKKRAHEASCFLAAEKGSFPLFDFEGYSKSEWYRGLSKGVQSKIKQYGIRNCALLTIAPTGTVGIVCGATSGIEPIFSYAYERRYYDGDEIKVAIVTHPLFEDFMRSGKDVSHFQNTSDLNVKDHLEIQKICQKHIDQSISKTINIPKGYPKKELYDLFLEYLPYIKGFTIYVEGSRGAPPLKSLTLDEAQKLLACPNGVCDL